MVKLFIHALSDHPHEQGVHFLSALAPILYPSAVWDLLHVFNHYNAKLLRLEDALRQFPPPGHVAVQSDRGFYPGGGGDLSRRLCRLYRDSGDV